MRIDRDPTGQTKDPEAKTILWSGDRIKKLKWETDARYPFKEKFYATGHNASVWVRLSQNQEKPLVRILVDEAGVFENVDQ